MNRQEYMRTLESGLRRLPGRDRMEAMSYYKEYFEEAGPENEQWVIEELGEPEEVAAQIIRDLAVKKTEKPEEAMKKGFSTVWIVILAVFAAPIGLPLALAIVIVMLAFGLVAGSFILAFFVVGICSFAGGICGIIGGVYLLFEQFFNGLSVMGAGALMIGIGILVFYASYAVSKSFFSWLGYMFTRLIRGGKEYGKNQE